MSNNSSDPKFARESFTWRRMHPWQVIALIVVAVAFAVLAFSWL
jgi:hypothetical protein